MALVVDVLKKAADQIDTSARIIWVLEKLGWVKAVRWPVKERLEMKRVQPSAS